MNDTLNRVRQKIDALQERVQLLGESEALLKDINEGRINIVFDSVGRAIDSTRFSNRVGAMKKRIIAILVEEIQKERALMDTLEMEIDRIDRQFGGTIAAFGGHDVS